MSTGFLLPEDGLSFAYVADELAIPVSIVRDRVLREVIPAWRRTEAGDMQRYLPGSYETDDEGLCFSPDERRRKMGQLVIKRSELDAFKVAHGDDLRSRPPHWPWGDYETELLRQLAAACKEFWSDFDASNAESAPKSEAVKGWLVQRGVGSRVAEVIAQILRADGLRAGPRKRK